MSADLTSVTTWVLTGQRRPAALWGLALAGVTSMYVGIYPVMGGEELGTMTDNLPQAMIDALGYEDIGTAAGYIGSSVYNLLAPVLLWVFGIGLGSRLIAGDEEAGIMELELTGPTSRASLYWQRLAALWINVLSLVLVVAVMTLLLVTLLDLDVAFTNLAAATLGLALLALAFATLAYGVGAATGRRGIALGGAAGVAVGSFMLNAIGPTVDADWMTAVSPFSWYSDPSPLLHGPNVVGFALLVALTSVATVGGLLRYIRRDLMV